MHWLYVHLGLNNGNSPWYLAWSGSVSTLERFGELGVLGVLVWRRHNCHVHHCWRLGKHPVDGTPFMVCKVHHPDVPHKLKAEDLVAK